VTAGGDPYRVLGVPEGASVADVKRAYRLLAKRHHPDAGEGSVARFLEIQAAYEVLVRRDPANGDRAGAARSSGRRPAQQGPRTAGARRTRGERPGDPGAPPTPGTEWARRPREAGGRSAAGSGAGSAAGSGGTGERARRGRGPRKATLGSTTYDEAREADEPTWEGADWYGPVSGTYWTVNPKEYADPRKHGPEYTARWAGRAGVGAPEPAPRSARGPIPGPAAAASPGWEVRSRVAPAATPRTGTSVGSAAWPRPLERFIVGAFGWLPFGTLLATAVGLPGGLIATLPLQVAGFAGMLWAPRFAWASAGGLAAVLGFAIPGIAALAAMGVAVRPGGPAPAGVIVLAALAWCGGAAVAAGGRLFAQPWRTRP
jgi:curved DNA-binding protein CbpA